MIKMHYGVSIDTDKPTTGVLANNKVEWLGDELMDGIDLAWEEHLKECKEDEHDRCGPDQQGDILIGTWKKDEAGLYEPDQTGEYAAIVRETVTQVIWSRHTDRGALCSPCYPGQVDLDTPGQYLAYTLPPSIRGEEEPLT